MEWNKCGDISAQTMHVVHVWSSICSRFHLKFVAMISIEMIHYDNHQETFCSINSCPAIALSHIYLSTGVDLPSSNIAARTFSSFSWLSLILMIATYAANLTAFLTVSKVTLPVNSLEELIAQQDYAAGVIGSSAHQFIFEVCAA